MVEALATGGGGDTGNMVASQVTTTDRSRGSALLQQGVYQPGKIREFQRSGKNREKSGNFVIGQGIFIVFVVNIILQKFAILALIFMLLKKKYNLTIIISTILSLFKWPECIMI
jgi:hypothetical protein